MPKPTSLNNSDLNDIRYNTQIHNHISSLRGEDTINIEGRGNSGDKPNFEKRSNEEVSARVRHVLSVLGIK